MNRMQPIIDLVRSATLTTFDEADLGVKTSIIYSMVNSSNGTSRGYQTIADDPENADADPGLKKSWDNEIRRANAVTLNLMAHLNKLSHAVVAEDAEVIFDSFYEDEDGTSSGDTAVEEVAVKQHPYAWAKNKLIQRGIWPDADHTPDWSKFDSLTLWKYDAVVKKLAARIIGAWIIQIRDTGDIMATKRSGADAILVSMCQDVINLNKIEDDELLCRKLATFVRSNAAGVVYVMKDKYTSAEVLEAFEDIVDLNEIDTLKHNIRVSGREVRRAIHQRLVNSAAFEAIEKGLSSLIKSDADEGSLRDYVNSFAEQLNGKQYRDLMVMVEGE